MRFPEFWLTATLLLASAAAPAGVVAVRAADFAGGEDISALTPGVTLSSSGGDGTVDASVYARSVTLAVGAPAVDTVFTVFGPQPPGGIVSFGSASTDGSVPQIVFRADFAAPTDFVAVDIVATDGFDPALLLAYGSTGVRVGFDLSDGTGGAGSIETASLARGLADIAFVEVLSRRIDPVTGEAVLGSDGNPIEPESFLLDNLRFNRPAGAPRPAPEPASLALAAPLALALLAAPVRRRSPRRRGPGPP